MANEHRPDLGVRASVGGAMPTRLIAVVVALAVVVGGACSSGKHGVYSEELSSKLPQADELALGDFGLRDGTVERRSGSQADADELLRPGEVGIAMYVAGPSDYVGDGDLVVVDARLYEQASSSEARAFFDRYPSGPANRRNANILRHGTDDEVAEILEGTSWDAGLDTEIWQADCLSGFTAKGGWCRGVYLWTVVCRWNLDMVIADASPEMLPKVAMRFRTFIAERLGCDE